MSNKDRLAAVCDEASAAFQKILDFGKGAAPVAEQIASLTARAKTAEDALATAEARHETELGQLADFIGDLKAGFEQHLASLQAAPVTAKPSAAPSPSTAPATAAAKA